MSRISQSRISRGTLYGLFCLYALPGLPAFAQSYAFVPAPTQELNRIYRIDRASGEVIACQFGIENADSIGITLCYPAGEGAKAGAVGDYGLVASSHRLEAGIFRVNSRNGEVSVCYVRGDQEVVCTPPAK